MAVSQHEDYLDRGTEAAKFKSAIAPAVTCQNACCEKHLDTKTRLPMLLDTIIKLSRNANSFNLDIPHQRIWQGEAYW